MACLPLGYNCRNSLISIRTLITIMCIYYRVSNSQNSNELLFSNLQINKIQIKKEREYLLESSSWEPGYWTTQIIIRQVPAA